MVDYVTLVLHLHKNFWCHVFFSTSLGFEVARAIPAIYRASTSKICYFEAEFAVKQDIFKLKVPVCYTIYVQMPQSI